jgi:hypothetical protein
MATPTRAQRLQLAGYASDTQALIQSDRRISAYGHATWQERGSTSAFAQTGYCADIAE